MKYNFKSAVLKGTIILTLAGIISRVIGFYYRIFLTRQIGSEGMGLFQLVTPILGISFALCSAGIQTAISRFSAAKENKGTWLTAGLVLALPLSLIFAFFTYCYADFIACRILLNADCTPLIKILAFTVPFSTFHNCVNGYYFGRKQAGLPAFSQLLEQIARVGTVYCYTLYCLQNRQEVTVLCAVYGNFAGELCSTLVCAAALCFDKKMKISFVDLKQCTKKIFTFSVPLTANKLLMHLLQSGESILIPAQLILFGYTSKEALSIYGVMMGMSLPLILFPSAITNSMSVMLLPEVSGAQSQKNDSLILHTLNRSIQVCMIMGIMSTFLFIFYGAKMGGIIFDEPSVQWFVNVLAWLCPFYYLTTTLGSILNGLGRTTLTCVHNIAGILLRIGFLVVLVPKIGIEGYLFGLLISQISVCIAHYICLNHMFHIGINPKEHIVVPFAFSLISIGISMLVYIPLCVMQLGNELLRLFMGACLAGIIFLLLLKCTDVME